MNLTDQLNLASLYSKHVTKPHEEHEARRLYVSDVGKCPRMVGYRLLGVEKDHIPDYEAINKTIMFDLSLYMEETLWNALDLSLRGVDYQGSVDIIDRENWGGRFDIIALYPEDTDCRIIEVKTVRGNAFRYPLPKTPHVYQAAIYHHYLEDDYGLSAPPILWYADRGGTNTPREYIVEMEDGLWDEITRLMDELEVVRKGVDDELPEKLVRVLELRSYGKQIVYEPDGQCKYCDYAQTCEPDLSTEAWANKDGPMYIPTRKARVDELRRWAEAREVFIQP